MTPLESVGTYRGWNYYFTGWKQRAEEPALYCQWIATRHSDATMAYASYPGNQTMCYPGSTFDTGSYGRKQPIIIDISPESDRDTASRDCFRRLLAAIDEIERMEWVEARGK